MTETSNIFLRWARLKQEAKTAAQRSEADSMGAEALAQKAATDAANNESFDPARLPSIDSIVADTDIKAFLQRSVPVELTRAALRQAWVSDPAIRDFIGIAENQWDFNDPNGIPGFGPLGTTMPGQAAYLSQVSLGSLKKPDLFAEEMSPAAGASKAVQSSAADQHAHREPRELHSSGALCGDICGTDATTENEEVVGQYEALRGRRRHGGALPR